MPDEIHRFAVQCIDCGKLPLQARSMNSLRERLKSGNEIFHYCSNCDRTWSADAATRGLLARQLSVKEWQ